MKDAVLVKTPSTVAAVEALLSDEQEGYSSAAIASGVCETLFDGIQVLYKGIQDETCKSLALLALFFAAYLPLSYFPSEFHEILYPRAIDRWAAPFSLQPFLPVVAPERTKQRAIANP